MYLRSLCAPYNDHVSSFDPQPYAQIPSFTPQPVPVRPTQLTRDNFHSSCVQSGRDCLVEFYADWCGACRVFEPQFEQLAAQLAPRDVQCGRVNIETERDLASQYGVIRVPSLMLVRNETIHHYTDINNIAGGPILDWVEDIFTRPLPPVFVTMRPPVRTSTRKTTTTTTTKTIVASTTEVTRCLRVCTREYE